MSLFDKKESKVELFKKASKGKSKEEIRKLENALLTPVPLPKYNGATPNHTSEIKSRMAIIVFQDQTQKDLIGEVLSIKTSVKGDTYITDISVLEWVAKQVRKGKMRLAGGKVKVIKKNKGDKNG